MWEAIRGSILGCLALVMFATVAVAASDQSEPTVGVDLGPTGLAATLPVDGYLTATLVVVGPKGFRVERSYRRGEPVALDLARLRSPDDRALSYPDGQYKWELRVTLMGPGEPPKVVSGQAREPDVTAGVREESEPEVRVVSGRFVVDGGAVTEVKEGSAERSATRGHAQGSLAKTTNTGGNHFVGNLTVESGGVCSGCTDGDLDLTYGELLVKDSLPWITMRATLANQRWR